MRVTIDDARCTGHGRCYSVAPALFEPDDLGNGRVIGDGLVGPGALDDARRAVANCPEQAITLNEETPNG